MPSPSMSVTTFGLFITISGFLVLIIITPFDNSHLLRYMIPWFIIIGKLFNHTVIAISINLSYCVTLQLFKFII